MGGTLPLPVRQKLVMVLSQKSEAANKTATNQTDRLPRPHIPGQSTQNCNSITKIIKMPLGQTQLPNAINLHIQSLC